MLFRSEWHALTQHIATQPSSPTLAHELADDYLRGLGLWMMQLAWAHVERASLMLEPSGQARWSDPQQAFQRWVWPEWRMRMNIMQDALANQKVSL